MNLSVTILNSGFGFPVSEFGFWFPGSGFLFPGFRVALYVSVKFKFERRTFLMQPEQKETAERTYMRFPFCSTFCAMNLEQSFKIIL